MRGNVVAGKNNGGYKYGGYKYGGYKYGGIAEKPPNLTRHYFTCNIILTNFTCHIAKLNPIFFPDCVFVCSFKVK